MRKMGYYYSSKFSGKCNVYIAICYFISLAVLGLSCIMWNFFFFFLVTAYKLSWSMWNLVP